MVFSVLALASDCFYPGLNFSQAGNRYCKRSVLSGQVSHLQRRILNLRAFRLCVYRCPHLRSSQISHYHLRGHLAFLVLHDSAMSGMVDPDQ